MGTRRNKYTSLVGLFHNGGVKKFQKRVVTVLFLTGFGTCMRVTSGIKNTFGTKRLLFALIDADSLYFVYKLTKNAQFCVFVLKFLHFNPNCHNVRGDVDMMW